MSLSRRSLLSAMAAVAGGGASGISPAQLAAATSVASMVPDLEDMHAGPVSVADDSAWWFQSRLARRKILRHLSEFGDEFRVPVRIASKRSWSPSYKDGLARREHARLIALSDALDNQSTGAKLLRLLTGEDAA